MYQVSLDVFSGPMDLLLDLVRKNELDIFDIPIHKITQGYLNHLSTISSSKLEPICEFLVMAAILIETKSRMLLPGKEVLSKSEEEVVNLELKRIFSKDKVYEEVASFLMERYIEMEKVYTRHVKDDGYLDVGLYDLVFAFHQLIMPKVKRTMELDADGISINERIDHLLSMFTKIREMRMQDLFSGLKTKMEFVVTFIAILELIRRRKIRAIHLKGTWIFRILG